MVGLRKRRASSYNTIMKAVLWIVVACLLLSSCGSHKKSYVGKWVGKPESSTGKSDPAQDFAKGMMGMMGDVRLEFPTEDTFKLQMLGMPIEGTVTKSGNQLILKAEKVMGMPPDKANKDGKADEPLVLTLSDDGESITIREGTPDEMVLVFKRDTSTPKTIQATLTDKADLDLVGKWKGTIDMPQPAANASQAEKDDYEQTKAMAITLDLRPDETFLMNMMMEVEGKWKREGGTVTLTPGKIAGMDMSVDDKKDPNNEPLKGDLSPDGRTLIVKHHDPKKGTLTLRKD